MHVQLRSPNVSWAASKEMWPQVEEEDSPHLLHSHEIPYEVLHPALYNMSKAGAAQGLRSEEGLPEEAGRMQKVAHDSCGPCDGPSIHTFHSPTGLNKLCIEEG